MKKQKLAIIACVGCLAAFIAGGTVLASSSALSAFAPGRGMTVEQETETAKDIPLKYELVRVYGDITSIRDGQIVLKTMETDEPSREIVIRIDDQQSRIVDAVETLPLALSDLKEGDFIYAYLEPTMTKSMPPIANAKMIITKIPQDYNVPEYLNIKQVDAQADGSLSLTSYSGDTYHIPADCPITPYLTRNMVYLSDLAEGRSILLWTDDEGNVVKIKLFPAERE